MFFATMGLQPVAVAPSDEAARGLGAAGTLAVVGTSARLLAASARRGGFDVVALDVFGDRDTRALAQRWEGIGAARGIGFDAGRLLAALRRLAAQRGVLGWVAGSGFEARPELLRQGAAILPLIGNLPETVARVRAPAAFYDTLRRLGVDTPPTRPDPPPAPAGWLYKDAHASGGWHVRAAGEAPAMLPAGGYFQREVAGVPMSLLVLGDGRCWRLVGLARQIVGPLGRRPYVYRGGIGPVGVPPAARARLRRMLDVLVPEFGLRGLNGIDFMLQGERVLLLELNPRPTASLALFDEHTAGGLLRAHVEVCRDGALPDLAEATAAGGVRGSEVVFATRAGEITPALADWLAARPDCRDLPWAGTAHATGDPVCTVVAAGASPAAVAVSLARQGDEVRRQLRAAGS